MYTGILEFNAFTMKIYFDSMRIARAWQATTLLRQRDHVFRALKFLVNSLFQHFWNFFLTLKLYYVVALLLSRSVTIVVCTSLSLNTSDTAVLDV